MRSSAVRLFAVRCGVLNQTSGITSLEDGEDGVDEVELYDSAPEDLLFAEGVGCVVELELAQGGGLA